MRSKDIEIPEPCHADWDTMRPESRGKFCFDCRKKVHDLSAMTQQEAKGFLERTACEDICISYEHDEQGNLVFQAPQPRPTPLVPLSRLRRPRRAAAAVMGAGLAAALAACAPHSDGPAPMQLDETVAFESPTVVIPHGQASESTPVPTSTVEDEPCDPEVQAPETTPVRPTTKRKGKIRRTAGAPRRRSAPATDPFASF